MTLKVILLSFMAYGGMLGAEPVPELAEFAREKIEDLSQAVAVESSPLSHPATGPWAFQRFAIDVCAKIGVGIQAANFDLIPELQLQWEREPHP